MKQIVWAGALALLLAGQQATPQQASAPQAIPDAPRPQTTLPKIPSIAPTGTSGESTSADSAAQPAPASAPAQTPAAVAPATSDADGPTGDIDAKTFTLHINVNTVVVPFTVKDSKGNLVYGLTSHDVFVKENGVIQQGIRFTRDAFPLAVAVVIDQSLTFDQMTKVNNALGALPAAFSAYDQVAVFTYNNGPKMQTTFTGAQSERLTAVLEQSKGTGREPTMAFGGPLSQNIYLNDGANSHIDPNTNRNHGTSVSNMEIPGKEVHTLNDAIYMAAKALTKTAPGSRRIIYVISDGKEYGSEVKYSAVKRFLQTNNISVFATLVEGTPSLGTGFLDRIHLPLTMRDDILPLYVDATGGQLDREYRTGGIETSFAKLAEQVRMQYTISYNTHESMLDDKFRTVDVHVRKPNLTIIAEPGYYPTATQNRAPAPVREPPPPQGPRPSGLQQRPSTTPAPATPSAP